MESIGKANVQMHASAIGCWLHGQIRALRWPDSGKPFAFLPAVHEPSKQATSVSFLPLLDDGRLLPSIILERLAMADGIAIRTGCFCNPGSGYHMAEMYTGEAYPKEMPNLLRASMGLASNFDDAFRCLTQSDTPQVINVQVLDTVRYSPSNQ
jgi:selenocysteine lyase/cysteine desulfurase